MFNFLLLIGCIILCFTLEVLVYKFFKRAGLFVWIAVASILANILVCKQVNFLGFATSLGSVMFASNFLATDILTIRYGKKTAFKAVFMGLAAVLGYILVTQLTLLFIPNELDFAQESMQNLFTLSGRICVASLTMYFLSNLFDVYIFDKLRKKFPDKLWLSNNTATIISNCGENFLFGMGAFLGIFPFWTIVGMQFVGCAIEIVIALLDTPFLYWAKHVKITEDKEEELVPAE